MKFCKTTSKMKDKNPFPNVQVTYLERIVDSAVANPFGIHSSPDNNSPALMFQVNNCEANSIIIPISAFNRNKDLQETEVEMGNFTSKSYVKFDKDGNIVVTCANNMNVTINGDCNITCNGTVNIISGAINLGKTTFEKIVKATKLKQWIIDKINDIFNGHDHDMQCTNYIPNPAIIGTTEGPNSSMDNPSETDIASDAHQVGD